ncbi:uncharacterized protein LOC131243851 [Magnolia sinica]|uniref:uncharacterized protein LOC131243851 n=1 Tax=Magnolia sinica TaxID=86752 RepID=UPI002658E282|nr:uncharacterized protein LOC131243851 [Magnolia sinica]
MEIGLEERRREPSEAVDKNEKWVLDSSLDYEGKDPLRASTGVWKASFFIIALEFSERLSYFGLATNLIIYLTKVLNQDLETAAKNVNYWTGVTTMMPLIGGFVADAYTGRYLMTVISSFVYLMGLILLTMSQYIPALKPCNIDKCRESKKLHVAVFFVAMYMISVATGGHKPSLESFGADQFDDDHADERKKRMSYFNLWNAVLSLGNMLGVTIIVYVQDHVSWGFGDIILTSVMIICTVIFIIGKSFYRYRSPNRNLLPIFQVFYAAIIKRNLNSTNQRLYEGPISQRAHKRLLSHTNKLRCLDKAAIIESHGDNGLINDPSSWRLATVTQVEEVKLLLNMFPIWLTTLMFGVCMAQATTFFIKQGTTMDRNLTVHFVVPPASISIIGAIAMIMTIAIYDKILVPVLRGVTGNERGISLLKRIGIGMALSALAMVIAAIVESKRLSVVEREINGGQQKGPISMSVFWLAPQFMIIGVGDGFTLVGLQEFFYDQVPDSMRSLGIAFYLSVIGASNFLSIFLITAVDHWTKMGGRVGWFAKELNKSHLDYFYWLLAAMTSAAVDGEKWVCDSSLDYKGRVPLRASTGAWKASIFLIALEFSERLSYFAMATNLITYLTKILHQDLKSAVKNVNYWAGVTTLMPLIGGFLADAYMGRYSTVLVSSIIFLMGLILLTMAELIPTLQACSVDTCRESIKRHEVVFFVAMYMISIGSGGLKPSLESFGADQFDGDHKVERRKKMSFFNWWTFVLASGFMLGVTVIVYIQDFLSWGFASIVLTSLMAVGVIIFLVGRPFYRYRVAHGSPLTPLIRVLVAAIAKRNLPHPSDPTELYEGPTSKMAHTNKLRFLDKAAIIEGRDGPKNQRSDQQNPWRLSTVTQVEEVKLVLNIIPMWLTSLTFGICMSQTTAFIKQASTMDRNLTVHFKIPPASIHSLSNIATIICVCIYDKILVPMLRRVTGNERGISIHRRIGIGMLLSILVMIAAATVERERLTVVEREGSAMSMTVFWLAPQFIILGIAEGFTLVGLQEYFYGKVPDNMRSLGIAMFTGVIGVGHFLTSFLIMAVDRLTEKGGKNGWFAKDLNKSHLDYFYWLLAAMSGANLCAYVYMTSKYTHKEVNASDVDEI